MAAHASTEHPPPPTKAASVGGSAARRVALDELRDLVEVEIVKQAVGVPVLHAHALAYAIAVRHRMGARRGGWGAMDGGCGGFGAGFGVGLVIGV